jgi:hypothetical protein
LWGDEAQGSFGIELDRNPGHECQLF